MSGVFGVLAQGHRDHQITAMSLGEAKLLTAIDIVTLGIIWQAILWRTSRDRPSPPLEALQPFLVGR